MKWKPIESAPKNGDLVLLYGFGTAYIAVGYFDRMSAEWEIYIDCYSCNGRHIIDPTHWIKLPDDPEFD